jgi:hypothetical protein
VLTRIAIVAAGAGLGATAALAADRASALIDCRATSQSLVYDCTIQLKNARSAAPLEQATLTIGADMPSMPIAHNVRPVLAKATGKPGEYRARLTLEMHGVWALRLTIAGPLRDQLVELRSFNDAGSGPPSAKRPGHRH